eukprot:scaffold8942_cov99-Isochrysis_galbana.AAC.4
MHTSARSQYVPSTKPRRLPPHLAHRTHERIAYPLREVSLSLSLPLPPSLAHLQGVSPAVYIVAEEEVAAVLNVAPVWLRRAEGGEVAHQIAELPVDVTKDLDRRGHLH